MTSGSFRSIDDLTGEPRAIFEQRATAALATVDASGLPHVVPVCYAPLGGELVTPIDAKPKSGRKLGRLANIEANPNVTLMVDRWDEDWRKLGWVMVRGTARHEPMTDGAMFALTDRYPQYEDIFVGSELIAIAPVRITWWTFA